MPANERTFVLLKPDGCFQGITTDILFTFYDNGMTLSAERIHISTRELAEKHLSYRPKSFEETAMGIVKRCEKENIPLEGTFLESKDFNEIGLTLKNRVVEYLSSGPVWAWVIEGPNVIARARNLCGATFPSDADPKSIRGMFGAGSFQACILEGKAPLNVIHSAECQEEADFQIKVWIPEYKL